MRRWIRFLFKLGLFFVCALIALLVFQFFISLPRAGAPVSVTIADESDARDVAQRLKRSGAISSLLGYRILTLISSSARRPRPGTYAINPGTGWLAIARRLASGPVRTERQIKIIEGWTLDDEMRMLERDASVSVERVAQLTGAAKNGSAFDPILRQEFPFLQALPVSRSLEGYLFPDTYRVWDDQLPESLVRKQLQAFGDRFGLTVPSAKSAPLRTLDQVVTLASIVEKEVRTPKDRRLVAGVFLRRMKEGMPLQSDATLTYLTGSTRGRATAEELRIDSPYNSYAERGLPPSPICHPGEDAIRAVLDPTLNPYRYFLTDPSGTVLYARTLEEHGLNRQRAGY